MPAISRLPTSTTLSGDEPIPLVQTGVTKTATLDQVRGAGVSVLDFGPMATAGTSINLAASTQSTGVGLDIPTGTATIDQAVTLTGNRMNLQGAGRWATSLVFNAASAGPVITVNNGEAGGYNQGRIADIGFQSNNSTAKTFLDLYNVANFEVARIACNSDTWPGDSIGIRTRGRQLVHIHGCEIGCARPIVISPNTLYPTLATDHFLIEDNEILGSSATRDVIEVESGVSFSSTTFRHNAVVGGRHGIYYNDTTSTAASYALLIDELRTEQGMDATAYSVYLASTVSAVQQVKISNSYLDSARNGIYLRNAQLVTIDNVEYSGGVGKTALNITLVDGSRLIMRNFFVQTGATVTITNGRCVKKEVSATGSGLVRNEEWVYDGGTDYNDGWEQSDVPHSGRPVTLTAGSTTVVGSGTYAGEVHIQTGNNVGAIGFCRGTSNSQTILSFTDAGWFGATSGGAENYLLYHDGSKYVLKNNTAFTQTVYIYRIGKST